MFPFRADCVNTILCLANLISARPGEQCTRSSGSLGDFRLRVDHREGRIDVGLECAIEDIGNKAERQLGDDIDDLRIGISCGSHCLVVGVTDVAPRMATL